MYKEFKVDKNLLYLETTLYCLDFLSFDKDITTLLNQLKLLVDEKIYSQLNGEISDIESYEIVFRYI